MSEIGIATNGTKHGAERTEEEKDHHHHDEKSVEQGLHDLVDGVIDVGGGVVGDLAFHPCGEFLLDFAPSPRGRA